MKIRKAILYVAIYFGVMLFYTFLDVVVWRNIFPKYSNIFNLLTIIICVIGFLSFLKKAGYQIHLFLNFSFTGLLLAIGCSILFFLLLDRGLDPIFEKLFPESEESYQETISLLIQSPVTSFLQVCIIAPIIEEILMRNIVLAELKTNYGTATALLISSILFALLHFNMVQTLSALICGILLGLLYLKTKSILCCIIAHSGYNLISYLILYSSVISAIS